MRTRIAQNNINAANTGITVGGGALLSERILGLVLVGLIIEILVVLGLGLGEGRT